MAAPRGNSGPGQSLAGLVGEGTPWPSQPRRVVGINPTMSASQKQNIETGSESEEEGREIAGKGMTTRSGKTIAPKQRGQLPAKGKNAAGNRGKPRSASLDERSWRRDQSTDSESEEEERSHTRSRSDRDTERGTEEEGGETVSPDTEPEHERRPEPESEEEIIIVDDDERSSRLGRKEVDQARKIMAETETMVEQQGVRNDCPSLAANTRKEGGQGRPAETGQYYLKQLQKASRELLEKAQEIRILREGLVPANLSNNRKLEEKKLLKELKNAPAEVLPATILEAVNGLDLVLEKSSQLKGEHRSRLLKSAAATKAAITLLVQRYEHPETGLERDMELEELRIKIAAQEEDLVDLHHVKAQNLLMQKELQELRQKVEELQARLTVRDLEPRATRQAERGGKKRKIFLPSSDSESPANEKEGHTGSAENKGADPETHMEDEEELIESSRDKVMEEIQREGMPEARRPPLQGRSALLDPAMPPAEHPLLHTEGKKDTGMEDRLAAMLVNCVRDAVGKMEKRLRADLIPQADREEGERERKKEKELPPLPRRETSKNKEKVAVGKEGKGGKTRPAERPQTASPVPTLTGGDKTTPWSQVLGRKTAAGSIPEPAPALAKKAGGAKPQTARKKEETKKEETQVAVAGASREEGWVTVKGRKGRGGSTQAKPDQTKPAQTRPQTRVPPEKNTGKREAARKAEQGRKSGGAKNSAQSRPTPSQQSKAKKRRVPRTAAVTLTCPEGEYADCMSTVRRRIQLEDLGITKPPNVRRTATGAISLEIAGQDNARKADALAARMTEALAGREGVKVSRPIMTADLRLIGFEESMSEEEIHETLSKRSDTGPTGLKVGPVRKMANGLCSVVVSCPLAMANGLVKEGKVALGWSLARAEMLEKRPLQCYRCMEMGHTRATCKSDRDRTGACYRCGEHGHPARECQAPTNCTVCKDKGLPYEHRVGGPSCRGCKKGGKKARTTDRKEVGNAVEGGNSAKDKSKGKDRAKPKKTSDIEVEGFEITEGGRLVAGVTATTKEPLPKVAKPQKRKTEGEQRLVKSDALRIVGVVTMEEPKEQRAPKRKKENGGDKAPASPLSTTVAMDLEEGAEVPPPGPSVDDTKGGKVAETTMEKEAAGETALPADNAEGEEELGGPKKGYL